MDVPSVTVSVARKVNRGNYESEDVFVSISGVTPTMSRDDMNELLECGNVAYDLICEEIARKVELIKNPPKAESADILDPTYLRITNNWPMENVLEFETICRNLGKDSRKLVVLAHETGCTSYDEYVAYAVSGTRPPNAKPRLELAE
jgi:hypothetical protein